MASSFAVTDFVKITVNKQVYLNRSTPKAALPVVAALAAITLLASALTVHAQSPAPAKPTGLTAESAGYETLTLVWDDPLDSSITGYQILRRFRDGSKYGDEKGSPQFEVIEENTGSAATRYVDRSIKPHTRYVYRVKARSANSLSERSTALEAETPKLPEVSQSDRLKDRIATILASPVMDTVGGRARLIGILGLLGALIWLIAAFIRKQSRRLPVMLALGGLALLVLSTGLWVAEGLRSSPDEAAPSTRTSPTAEPPTISDPTIARRETPPTIPAGPLVVTFEPTAGMLASVPVGRMSIACWTKEAKLDGEPPLRAACEAKDSYGELFIDVAVWGEGYKREMFGSLAYFRELESGLVEVVQCDDMKFERGVSSRVRGESFPGHCTSSLRSLQEAKSVVRDVVNRWTSYSGLSERTQNTYLNNVLGLLKR